MPGAELAVSIPRRYAKNEKYNRILGDGKAEFQSLVGTLKTKTSLMQHQREAVFQSLVGTLKTAIFPI